MKTENTAFIKRLEQFDNVTVLQHTDFPMTTTFKIKDGGLRDYWGEHVKWSDGITPTLSNTGINVICCVSDDGIIWYGFVAVKNVIEEDDNYG